MAKHAEKPQVDESKIAEEAAAADLKGPEGVTLVIKGPALGRWRIGRKFGPEPVAIPLSELTAAQAQALDDDPLLMISVVQDPL